MAQLCQYIDEFQALNTKVIIITFGTLPAARVWLKETCSPFHLLLDTQREAYRSYGLERSFLRSWGLKTLWHYMRLLASGTKWRGIQGDSTQLGGDFIVDKDGTLLLYHPSSSATDRPSIKKLLTILRQAG